MACRQIPTKISDIAAALGSVDQLVVSVRTIGEQLVASERARQDDRVMIIALRSEIITLKEKVANLTWRTFRQPNQPSSLLIGSSLIRDVNSATLVDPEVVCLPGGKLAGIEQNISELSSGYDTITVVAGGNDCDTSPSTPAPTVIDAFASVIDAAKAKASTVNGVQRLSAVEDCGYNEHDRRRERRPHDAVCGQGRDLHRQHAFFHARRRECERRVPPSRRCPPDARGRKPTGQEPAVEETKRCIRCLLGGTETPTPASPSANSSERWRRC